MLRNSLAAPMAAPSGAYLLGTDASSGSKRILEFVYYDDVDPKQAIYKFRGADVDAYMDARTIIERRFPENRLKITTSFRSRGDILTHINACFQDPLGRQAPGYVALSSSLDPAQHGLPCVMKATIRVRGDARDEEAQKVADICASLIGNIEVRRADGTTSPLRAGDIALLAPVGTGLWRYERALEEKGLPLVSKAGRNLFRRQEAQDFVALVRALAEPRDTLALGALLRSPLVGLTDHELLDITNSITPDDGDPRQAAIPLTLQTPPERVANPLARETLAILASLRRRARYTTPFLLLSEAIDRLYIRAKLAARSDDQAARALANLDFLMERARRYGTRGLQQFARDIDADWTGSALGPKPHDEAPLDGNRDAIELITVHSAKGLEWPVVIPINTGSKLRPRPPFIHRRHDDTLHWILGDVTPPAIDDAIQREDEDSKQERERLLYVACTRAMELLILPTFSTKRTDSWSQVLHLRQDTVPEFDPARLVPRTFERVAERPNRQTADQFSGEQAAIEAASQPVRWIRPSDGDVDRLADAAHGDGSVGAEAIALPAVAGSAIRGSVLHKLLEEMLTGEVEETTASLEARGGQLLRQLCPANMNVLPDPVEMAAIALQTLTLPGVAEYRMWLMPELALFNSRDDGTTLMAGRADAVALDRDRPLAVFDWKSDVAPSRLDRAAYAGQLRQYMEAINAPRGAVVYLTLAEVDWIDG